MTVSFSGKFAVVAALVSAACVVLINNAQDIIVLDDAYISYRYACNLANGNGFVYNDGERVLGTTSPLYTMVLACVSVFTGNRDLETVSIAINTVALASSGFLLVLILNAFGAEPAVALAFSLWAVLSVSGIRAALYGLETSFFIFLILAGIYLLHRSTVIAALIAVAATLTRPEGVFLFFSSATAISLTNRKRLWRYCFWSFLFAVPWAVFATSYFGSPIPMSIIGKKQMFPHISGTAFYIFDEWSYFLFGEGVIHALTGKPLNAVSFTDFFVLKRELVFLFLGGVVGVLGIVAAVRRRAFAILFFPFLFMAFYLISKPFLFAWYLLPLSPFFSVATYFAVSIFTSQRILKYASVVVALTAAAFQISLFSTGDTAYSSERIYGNVGRWLTDKRSDRPAVMATTIGALGMNYPGKIIDAGGLVSPECLEFLPAKTADRRKGIFSTIPSEAIMSLRPPVLVSAGVSFPRTLISNGEFQQSYKLIRVFYHPTPGNDVYVFFRTGT